MTEPTDKEQYLNIADQCAATATSNLAASILVDGGNGTLRQLLNDAADAIRAGWSTPQPTRAQAETPCRKNPFYHGPRNCSRGTVGCCEDHGGNPQAQAGAVPLTDEQLAEMMRDTWGCASIAPRHALQFARDVERAHGIGIKGGQHGAE